jgi:predicted metal-dependent hydrolase
LSTNQRLAISGINVDVVRKEIKNLHLAVYPPDGRVRVSAPETMPIEVVRAAVVTRLAWVKRQRARIANAPRQSTREMVTGESHYFLGQRYRLRVIEHAAPPEIMINGKTTLVLKCRASAADTTRLRALDAWYREELAPLIPPLLNQWSERLEVEGVTWKLRHMRTRWATVNTNTRAITLNPEIAKQPLESLELLIVHELVHLLVKNHGENFSKKMSKYLPDWRQRQSRLNSALIAHEDWKF